MSKKRIVEETLSDGTVQYRVEVYWCPFFWREGYWATDKMKGCQSDAVFRTLGEAELHAFGSELKAVKREILNYD